MRTIFILVMFAMSSAASAQSAIVCEGKTRFGGALTLTLFADQSASVTIMDEDGESFEQGFAETANVWDGHGTGLITAPGLSVKYNNWFGCIRNVVVTTNVRDPKIGFIDSVTVPVCRGGGTPDQLCLPETF